MKKFFRSIICSVALCFCVSGPAFAESSLDQIKSRGYIKVATNAEFEPFEYRDGANITGIDIDIARKIAESLGVPAEFNDVSFSAVTLELDNKNCDFAIAAMSYSEDKAASVDFSDEYYISKQAVIVPSSSDIKSGVDLFDKKIGVQLGTTGDIYCTENFQSSEMMRYNNPSDALLDLLGGRLDAIVVDEIPAQKLVKLSANKAGTLDEYLFEEGYRIAVPQGETELLKHINEVIGEMKSTGEIQRITAGYASNVSTPSVDIVAQVYNNFVYKSRYKMILSGLLVTLEITSIALVIGIVIGLSIALIKTSTKNSFWFKILKALANVYLTVIRGTPVVVQLFVIYYLIFASTGLSKLTVAMIAFGINSGAYVSEIIRSGILSVDHGQYEAGISLGLSPKLTMSRVVFPQALKNVLPTLLNEFIQLVKETSVAGFIGVMDLSRSADVIRSQTYEPLIPLVSVALIYLVIVIAVTFVLSALERRMRAGDKR